MWIEKLAEGVLQMDTPIGPRYVRLTFPQRAYLLWMFRNFPSLPQQVLSVRQQRMVERLCEENGFAAVPGADATIIGRIERRMPASLEIMPARKPMSAAKPTVREQEREAASA